MTAPMFDTDQAENDRLLLEAEQRKRDLIEHAIRRYAPELAGKPDVKVVHLYSTNATLRKEIRSIVGGKTILVEHVLTETKVPGRKINEVVEGGARLKLPTKADMVVTKTTPTKATDWLAARLGTWEVVVLPEAEDYLIARLDKQRILTIVGAEQAK